MHNMHEGSWLKRWRIRLFGLTAREQAENMAAFARLRAEVAAECAREDAEDEALLASEVACDVGFGDGRCTGCGALMPVTNAEDCGLKNCPIDPETGLSAESRELES